MAYAKYISIIDRRIATIKGVTLCFKAMEPLEVHPDIVEDVIAAGIVREDIFEAAMQGRVKPADELAVAAQIQEQESQLAESVAAPEEDSFDAILAEMEGHKAEQHAKAEAQALAEAEEAKEKSPAFDKAVFEAACREIIATNDPANLTPKGAPKASVVSDLVGFEVKAIQITNFLRHSD